MMPYLLIQHGPEMLALGALLLPLLPVQCPVRLRQPNSVPSAV